MDDLECTHSGCSARFLRAELAAHEASCEYRLSACVYCLVPYAARCMESHVQQCESLVIVCPHGCGGMFKRSSQAEHDRTCPDMVVSCDVAGHGCGQRFKRRRTNEHANEAALVHERISSLARELERYKRELELCKQALENTECIELLAGTTQHKLDWEIRNVGSKCGSIDSPAASYFCQPWYVPTSRGMYKLQVEAKFSWCAVSFSVHLLSQNAAAASDAAPVNLSASRISPDEAAVSLRGSKISLVLRRGDEEDVRRLHPDSIFDAEIRPGQPRVVGKMPGECLGPMTLTDLLSAGMERSRILLRIKIRVNAAEQRHTTP